MSGYQQFQNDMSKDDTNNNNTEMQHMGSNYPQLPNKQAKQPISPIQQQVPMQVNAQPVQQQYVQQQQYNNMPQQQNYPLQNQQPYIQDYQQQPNAQHIPVMYTQAFSRNSQQLYCKRCELIVPSITNYEIGKGTWLLGCLITPLLCFFDCSKDAIHYCPNCGFKIGQKGFIFD